MSRLITIDGLKDSQSQKTSGYKASNNSVFQNFKKNFSPEDAKELTEAMTLTSDEKNFIMTYCMRKVNSWQAVQNFVAPFIAWIFSYNAGQLMNKKLNLFSKPRWMRLGLVGKYSFHNF